MWRSRRELSNEYLLAKIGVDTAGNEPLEVCGKIFNIIHWCPYEDPPGLHSRGDLPRDPRAGDGRALGGLAGALRLPGEVAEKRSVPDTIDLRWH